MSSCSKTRRVNSDISRYFHLYAIALLPVFASAQRWLAYRADSELARQVLRVTVSHATREQSRVGQVQLLVDNS